MLVQQAFMKFHLKFTIMYLKKKNRDCSMKCTMKGHCHRVMHLLSQLIDLKVNTELLVQINIGWL